MNRKIPAIKNNITEKERDLFTLNRDSYRLDEQQNINIGEMASADEFKDALEQINALKEEYERLLSTSRYGPTAPNVELVTSDDDEEFDAAAKLEILSVDTHRFIRELLGEIREFDGTSDVEAFLTQIRNARDQLNTPGQKRSLVRKIVATKLKGDAQRVAERNRVDKLRTLGEALRTAFGKLEVEYEQLAEERNGMRQGINESVMSYIQRYEEIDKRIQCSLDSMDIEFRDVTRRMENKINIDKFIRGLRKEIRTEVKLGKPESLRAAFLTARKEEKNFKDDEILRRRQEHRPAAPSLPNKGKQPAPSIPTRQTPPSSDRARASVAGPCAFCRGANHTEQQCFHKHPELRTNFQTRRSSFKGPPRQINYEDQPEEEKDPLLSHEEETANASDKDKVEWAAVVQSTGHCGSDWEARKECATSSSIQERQYQL